MFNNVQEFPHVPTSIAMVLKNKRERERDVVLQRLQCLVSAGGLCIGGASAPKICLGEGKVVLEGQPMGAYV